jgi:hypothetical protein
LDHSKTIKRLQHSKRNHLRPTKPWFAQARVSNIQHLIEEKMIALVDITHETEYLIEIKDSLDELNSISYIFREQLGVV